MTLFSSEFSERMVHLHGETATRWLADVASLLAECQARWDLELDNPLPAISYNLIIPGRTSSGMEIVLKLGVPCREFTSEAQALAAFAGDGAAGLVAADPARGAMLIERVNPGTTLGEIQNESQAPITAARLLTRLWQHEYDETQFPSLTRWLAALDRFAEDFSPLASLVTRARAIRKELTASGERKVLLHADLHQGNILFSSTRGWLAIDPKGVVGDPGYDVGPFMLNLIPRSERDDLIEQMLLRRLSLFSRELKIEQLRLARWAFCHAVLSALWDLEEGSGPAHTVRVAALLERLC